MRSQSHSITIAQSRDVVWEFLADCRNDLEWRSELKGCELVAGTPGEVGTRYRCVVGWEGLRSEYELVCVAADRPGLIGYRTTVEGAATSSEYVLEDGNGETLITVRFAFEIGGALNMLEPFAWGLLTRWARSDVAALAGAFDRSFA